MKKWITILLTLSLFTVANAQESDHDFRLASDINADGIINILDLVFVASHFGESPSEDQIPNPDINRDEIVDILDLTQAAIHFGKFSGVPLILTDKTFDNVIRNAKLPILVDFKSDY